MFPVGADAAGSLVLEVEIGRASEESELVVAVVVKETKFVVGGETGTPGDEPAGVLDDGYGRDAVSTLPRVEELAGGLYVGMACGNAMLELICPSSSVASQGVQA